MHGSTGQLPFSALDPSLELEPWPRRQCADFQPNPILLALLATALTDIFSKSQRLKAKILKFRYSSKAPKVNKASCNNNNNNNKDDNNNGGGPRWDMEEIKSNVALLLEGKPYEEMHEFCDFTLEEQNEVQVAKGVQPSAPNDFKPIIKKNVSYIVAAVLINDQGEVLMMQEAKSTCAGQWYLPAGRMEPGEDIAEAAQREVLEETGLHFQLTTLLMAESAGGSWYRYVVTGEVTGGRLKTPADADKESLQAKWISDLGELSLRANDVLTLVEKGRQYYAKALTDPWHSQQLPAIRPHNKLLLRLVIVIRRKENNRVNVLVSEKTAAHLPVCEINPNRSIHSTLKKYMVEIFGNDLPPHRPHGLLSIEHSGKPAHSNDGSCLTLIISVRIPLEDVVLIDKYAWLELDRSLGDEILGRLGKNMTVPLAVIR